jgi:hypothetical protein
MAREKEPEGLLKFEAEMRALGRHTTLVWALEAPPGHPFTLHAEYAVGRAIVYVQVLPGGGWRVGPSSPLRTTTPMPC